MKLNFDAKSPVILVAETPVLFKSEFSGRPMKTHIRIDSREPRVRVDHLDLAIWVAIDDGDGFDSVEEAKAFASRWADAAKAQATFHPKMA